MAMMAGTNVDAGLLVESHSTEFGLNLLENNDYSTNWVCHSRCREDRLLDLSALLDKPQPDFARGLHSNGLQAPCQRARGDWTALL